MRTAPVEKTVFAGGLGTTGLVNIYLPLCDGCGRQVLFGIAEELLKASLRYGPCELPEGWGDKPGKRKERYRAAFSPASCVLALDELLEQAGVDIWYDTTVTGAILESDRIQGLSVFNKSGYGELRAAAVIDASGDADIAVAAGAPCIEGRGVTQFVLRSRGLLRKHYLLRQKQNGKNNEFPVCLPSMAQYRTTRRIDGRATLMAANVNRGGIAESVGLIPSWYRAGRVWELPYGALQDELKRRGILLQR